MCTDYSVFAGRMMAEICGLSCERWKGSGFCDADGQWITAITILVHKNKIFHNSSYVGITSNMVTIREIPG